MRDFGIIQIDDILVSSEIITEYFACNYDECRGVCCVIGDSGAPLTEDEAQSLERNYPIYSGLMQETAREAVARTGFFEIDSDGDMVTPLVRGTEECVFTHFDGDGNCFCSPERCWFRGECSFRKPVSCWLYPVRVSVLSNGMTALNLHRWDICRGAFLKGRREGVKVFRFLKEPLTAMYGEDFYEALCQAEKELG